VAKQKFLKLISHEMNGEAGIMHIRVCSVEVDDENPNHIHEGPHKLFGIDHESLQRLHGGDLKAWLRSKKDEMVRLHNAQQMRDDELAQLRGELL